MTGKLGVSKQFDRLASNTKRCRPLDFAAEKKAASLTPLGPVRHEARNAQPQDEHDVLPAVLPNPRVD
eukprot:6450283-Lingulodinium_polyedra.AAC.1